MKRLIGLILALVLVLSLAAGAVAAGKPTIKKQPQTATTKKGVISFSVDVKSNGAFLTYTWRFVNPQTGAMVTGKKLSGAVKGVRVVNPNSKKIILKKVPKEMHGWQVYCHITGNGYQIDSDVAIINVAGEPPIESASAEPAPEPAPAEQPTEAPAPAEQPTEAPQVTEAPAPAPAEEPKAEAPAEEKKPEEKAPAEPADGTNEDAIPEPEAPQPFTVSATGKYLIGLDAHGSPMNEDPVSSLEFTGSGSFIIKSEYPIKNWSVNGAKFEPAEPVTELKVTNVTEKTSLNVSVKKPTAADAQLDESHMCKVVCEGCTFTFRRGGLISVAEGEVPSGAIISIIAGDANLIANGYSINGGEPDHNNLSSFRLTVTDDVTITLK